MSTQAIHLHPIGPLSCSPPIRRWLVAVALALATVASPALAQYTSPGSARPSGDIPQEKGFEQKIADALIGAGAFHFQPWLGVSNASFVTVEGSETSADVDDFTATVGAGIRTYLSAGGKVYFTAHLLPEYVWWSDLEDRRRTNGRYGVGIFGYFNRLRFEASGRRDERQGFFSSEIRQLTTVRQDTIRLAGELDLANRFVLVGRYVTSESTNVIDEEPLFSRLDREEERLLLELRYRFPGGWLFGLGWEDHRDDFAVAAEPLSTRGDGIRGLARFEGNRINAQLDVSRLSLEAEGGDSLFPGFEETVGELAIAWNLAPRLDMLTYTRREFSYAVDLSSAYYLADRTGARLTVAGRSAQLGLIAEFGQDDYEPLAGLAAPDRSDDVTELGLTFDVEIGRWLIVGIDLRQSDYDSNLDRFDREVTNLGLRVELGRLLDRLSLGDASGVW